MNTVEHLAAAEPDISLKSWSRPKQSLKETEFGIYSRQVAKNTTPNECRCIFCWMSK